MVFTKIRDVNRPNRAHKTDAGIDFYIPSFTPELFERIVEISQSKPKFISDDTNSHTLVFKPGDNFLIPLGIKVQVKPGEALVAFNKSGIASKKGLTKMAQVVDEHYSGEVHLNLINASNETVRLDFGAKAIQFLQLKINQDMPSEVSNSVYDNMMLNSNRGDNGFGSTDNK